MTSLINPPATDADPITERVRATWTSGDFGRIAKGYERGAGEFIARLGLAPAERVLDVACGTGNLVSQAQSRAAAESLSIAFEVGDAESLPYDNGSFETVVTMFGAMFAGR